MADNDEAHGEHPIFTVLAAKAEQARQEGTLYRLLQEGYAALSALDDPPPELAALRRRLAFGLIELGMGCHLALLVHVVCRIRHTTDAETVAYEIVHTLLELAGGEEQLLLGGPLLPAALAAALHDAAPVSRGVH
jgi:hypothetical protein